MRAFGERDTVSGTSNSTVAGLGRSERKLENAKTIGSQAIGRTWASRFPLIRARRASEETSLKCNDKSPSAEGTTALCRVRKFNGSRFESQRAVLKTGSSFRFQTPRIAVRPPWPLAVGEGA